MLDNTQTICTKVEFDFFNKEKEHYILRMDRMDNDIDDTLQTVLMDPLGIVEGVCIERNHSEDKPLNFLDIRDIYLFDSNEEEPKYRIEIKIRNINISRNDSFLFLFLLF